ncbi:hypothetical protein OPQ81_008517 [Rhizoctonia solani]|nr:hypothetical protein OPQ81_008517 [Rhizoctonia solani]
MYAMTSTHPDIAYAVSLLAQHTTKPSDEHWKAVKHVFRYLQGTRDLGITYSHLKPVDLVGYVDADYAGDKNSSRSMTGWAFLVAGGTVAWSLHKQETISLSSPEAEYVAIASAARELVWIRQFLSELGFSPDGPTTMLTDNQSSIALA